MWEHLLTISNHIWTFVVVYVYWVARCSTRVTNGLSILIELVLSLISLLILYHMNFRK